MKSSLLLRSPFLPGLCAGPVIYSVLLGLSAAGARGQAVTSEWNTSGGFWNVAGNWAPSGVPDNGGSTVYSVLIGNRAVAANSVVTFVPQDGSTDTVSAFTLSGAADFYTNGNNLTVNNGTVITGNNTVLRLDTNRTLGATALNTGTLQLNNSGQIVLAGGILQASGLMEINAGTTVTGYGRINVGDTDATVEKMMKMGGTITVAGTATMPGSLTIQPLQVDTVDLDGDTEGGVLNVSNAVANVTQDTLTLTVNAALADAFSGTLLIGQRDTALFSKDFHMNDAVVTMDGGNDVATLGGTARIPIIEGSAFNISGHAVINNDILFTGPGNSMSLNTGATIEFNGMALIEDAGTFFAGGGTGATVVAGGYMTVNSSSTPGFDFDRRNWVVKPGGTLIVSVGDYDPDDVVNVFNGSTITMDTAELGFYSSTDNGIRFDSTFNANGGTAPSQWYSAYFQLGDHTGTLSAKLNVTGRGGLIFDHDLYVMADADVNIGEGSRLWIKGYTGFTTYNGTDQARVKGAAESRLVLGGDVAVVEPVTLDLQQGTVTLDGDATTSHQVWAWAPLTINAASMPPYGLSQDPDLSHYDTLKIDRITTNATNSKATMQVNLAQPADTWTIAPRGQLHFYGGLNDTATYLSGNPLIMEGKLKVEADARTNARLILAGTASVPMASAGSILRLNGGDADILPNTIFGATVGTAAIPGTLRADAGRALTGYGTIHSAVDFDATANLLADNGTLALNGAVLHAGVLGTLDGDGSVNVAQPWNSSGIGTIRLKGGHLSGGVLTLANVNGLTGDGSVECRVINNSVMEASTGYLTLTRNDCDLDGAAGNGILLASGGSQLLAHGVNGTTFSGAMAATGDSKLYFRNFSTRLLPGSSLKLQSSVFECNSGVQLQTAIGIQSGSSTIDAGPYLMFLTPSSVSLEGDLRLQTTFATIPAGVPFSGPGTLTVNADTTASVESGASMDVKVANLGRVEISTRPPATGRVDLKAYYQSGGASLALDIGGPGDFERLVVNKDADIGGTLNISLTNGFVPVAGQMFDVLSAGNGVTGVFSAFPQPANMPEGLLFHISYLPGIVRLTVARRSAFDDWIDSWRGLGSAADRLRTADPDQDGETNFSEFAFDGVPVSGLATGKLGTALVVLEGERVMVLTIPVRVGAVVDAADPAGGALVLRQVEEGVSYSIEASDNFTAWGLDVKEVTGPVAAEAALGLPVLHEGWEYRTFRGPAAGRVYFRVVVGE